MSNCSSPPQEPDRRPHHVSLLFDLGDRRLFHLQGCGNLRLRLAGRLAQLPEALNLILELAISSINALTPLLRESIDHFAECSTHFESPSPRGRLLQSFQMCGEAFIGRCDQLLVEAALAHSRLVACEQQDTLSTRVKSKSHSPGSTNCIESKLFHVGVLGPLESVYIGAPELRPVLCKHPRGSQQFVLNPLRESQEFLSNSSSKRTIHGIYIASQLYSPEPITCQCEKVRSAHSGSVFRMASC